MPKLMQYYLQSLAINGVEVPREDVVESSYIELMNFTGPVLIVKVRDVSGAVLDGRRVKRGSVLVATLGDAAGRYSLFQETFYVAGAPYGQDAITITAIAADAQKLLIPAAQPRYFTQKQPSEIIRELAPGLKVTADSLSRVGTWHMIMGQKPAVLLKQIARDTGAMAWVARRGINFKMNQNLLNQRPAFSYEYNNPKARLTINKIRIINSDGAYSVSKEYRFMGYSETEGLKVAGDAGLPIKMESDADLGVLKNKHTTMIPVLDAEVSGNPGIQAGQVITVTLHRYDNQNQINESVPKNMVVERVTHYESRYAYLSRMILAVPFEDRLTSAY